MLMNTANMRESINCYQNFQPTIGKFQQERLLKNGKEHVCSAEEGRLLQPNRLWPHYQNCELGCRYEPLAKLLSALVVHILPSNEEVKSVRKGNFVCSPV